MPGVDLEMLRSVPLFELLDEEELASLAGQLDLVSYLAGQRIFSAGDSGGMMYVVQTGRVELFVQNRNRERIVLGFLEEGEIFGELALLGDEHYSASAKAIENTVLFRIDRNDLLLLVRAHPAAALDMMSMLGKRIREADFLLQDQVVTRNVNTEIQHDETTFGERFSDLLTRLAGDIRFVYFNLVWFLGWIVWNLNIVPGVTPFDPFPFGLLTMIVSLEAIFLSLFVLISQNRQAAREKVRNDVEYEVNIKAELEIRDLSQQVDDLQELMLRHLSQMNTSLQVASRKLIPGENDTLMIED